MIKKTLPRRRPGAGRTVERRSTAFAFSVADGALALLALLLLALIAVRFDGRAVEMAPGVVQVIDGDTLIVLTAAGERARLRLAGLDAPEAGQHCAREEVTGATETYDCGAAAQTALFALSDRDTICQAERRDIYGRLVGRCAIRNGDLGAALVAAGHAVADGAYFVEEAEARLAGRGIWAGSFDRPADWRRLHGATAGGAFDGEGLNPLEAIGAFVRGFAARAGMDDGATSETTGAQSVRQGGPAE
jgi:endonuclease YncB( thermonuclease family)